MTIRFGRSVAGTADIIGDVLLGSDKSVLLLGEPGSGKTTLLRDVARMLAVENNVAVVDTSSEIAGDGSIAHDCMVLLAVQMAQSCGRSGWLDALLELLCSMCMCATAILKVTFFSARPPKNN